MSIEDQVLALIEEGNPVPDPASIETLPAEPADYLATLRRRSSEVTQLEERTQRQQKDNRRWLTAAAAVLAVVAGIVIVLLSGGDEEPPVITEPPVTTTLAADPTALVGSWSAEPVSVVFDGDAYSFIVDGVLVDTGTYATDSGSNVVAYTSGDQSPGCSPGTEGTMFYETAGDQIVLTPGDDTCFFRALLTADTGPMSSMASIDVSQLPTEYDMAGSWGDTVAGARFQADTYTFVADGEVVDTGTYELQLSPYQLALTPDAGSECDPITYGFALQNGEVLVLEAPEDESCLARMQVAFRNLEPSELDQAEAEWQAIPVWSDTASDGTYRTAVYGSPFSFVSHEEWHQTPGGSTETSHVIQLLDMSPLRIITMTTDMTVEEVIAEYVAAHTAIPEAEMSEPAPAEVGGANGMSFESVGLPFQVDDESLVPFVGEDYLLDPGMSGPGAGSVPPILGAGKALFHVLDVGGVTNLVVYQGIPSHYDENLETALEFLDSMQWKDAR